LFAIEHASRRAYLLGVTEHPGNDFVTQAARNLVGDLAETSRQVKFLIRDRDTKFTARFDEVFRSEGAEVIKAPVPSPQANALAERFVRTVRTEYLDWTLVLGRRHLEAVLREYIHHYNERRPRSRRARRRSRPQRTGRLRGRTPRRARWAHPRVLPGRGIALGPQATSKDTSSSQHGRRMKAGAPTTDMSLVWREITGRV
jgi:hypothetical protein